MKTTDLQTDRIYRCSDGRTRKVLRIAGRGRNRQVQISDHTHTKRWLPIKTFADSAAQEVTPAARTALVRK